MTVNLTFLDIVQKNGLIESIIQFHDKKIMKRSRRLLVLPEIREMVDVGKV